MSSPKQTGVRFYTTAEYDCSYLAHQRAASVVAAPAQQIDAATYNQLIAQGFRRSGQFVYKPYCAQCKACIPIRLDCKQFTPNRSQRRLWQKFQSLSTHIKTLAWNEEHYALYSLYQAIRHPDSAMNNDNRAQYLDFIVNSPINSYLVEFRHAGQLKMVALMDELDHGLSAVYTFFDPYTSGLGNYAILWQQHYCLQRHKPWLYLGYWIAQSPKMAYKTRYKPYQLYIQDQWLSPSI